MSDNEDKGTSSPSFVDVEKYLKDEAINAEKKDMVVKPTPTELAFQSMAVAFIKIAQALERIASALEAKNVKVVQPTSTSSVNTSSVSFSLTKYSSYFPKELRDLLSFTVEEDKVVVKPVKFLGSENFAKIASIVREKGGRYVSAGRKSHFELPK